VTSNRQSVVNELAAMICDLERGHVRRIAIDGTTGAGKTTLANELAFAIDANGVPVERLTMDGYHNPKKIRYRQGRMEPMGYYQDAYDFEAFAEQVLKPLGPQGNGTYVPKILDLASDTSVSCSPVSLTPDAVLVVDGSFLQKPVLAHNWDLVVFLQVDLSICRQRGIERDQELLGGREQAAKTFNQRYQPAARHYLATCRPADSADVRLVNDHFDAPQLIKNPAK